MSATSPAPWEVTSNGGAMTIVARDRSVVAVVLGSGAAAPFESSNAALMAAGPELHTALRHLAEACEVLQVPGISTHEARAALAKAVGP
jgi:hypothetical protein